MFKTARLKLTVWYLVIIMAVSLLFSAAIYQGASLEVERSLRAQQFRIERDRGEMIVPGSQPPAIDESLIEDANGHIMFSLIVINFVILTGSAVAGYFLAGRTLAPIEEMVREQNRFITDSSHELRTPLTALKTSIEVGLRDQQMKLTEARHLLSENLADVNSLITFSNDLIKLTVYQKPNGNIKITSLNVKEIIDEAIRKVSPLAKDKQIRIEQKTGEQKFFGDGKSVTELFVILLDNAIKYSNPNSKITITATGKNTWMVVKVKDTGVGIAPEDLPHIFDRLYRADKSRSKEVAGFGLGLSIAKEIVTINRGSIRAESKPDKGTTFIVELPVQI